MTKFVREWYVEPIKSGVTTERGEKVYTALEIILVYPDQTRTKKVLVPDEGLGFTEEWIEETIQGCLEGLKRDFPDDVYRAVKDAPNKIRFVWVGPKGLVN